MVALLLINLSSLSLLCSFIVHYSFNIQVKAYTESLGVKKGTVETH